MTSLQEQVAAGIEFLDASGPPNWREKIDLDRLNLASPFSCVLGQLYRGYVQGREALSLNQTECVALGYDGPHGPPLTEEWKRQLAKPVPAPVTPTLTLTREQLNMLTEIASTTIFVSLTVNMGGVEITVTP